MRFYQIPVSEINEVRHVPSFQILTPFNTAKYSFLHDSLDRRLRCCRLFARVTYAAEEGEGVRGDEGQNG